MTTINSISQDFKFSLTKLPKVEYFCTEVNIPGLQLGNATQLTYIKRYTLPGTKLDFGDLILTFLVDEKFENFEEIYTWLRSLGFSGEHGICKFNCMAEIDFLLKVKVMKTQTQVEKVQQLLKCDYVRRHTINLICKKQCDKRS